ncbi:hypothetical protein FRC12_017757 [Ceratobasidium sp. 428]|nr:hypothetical protein FRC12_017757 [Ceratobasidium sp. 428]
MGAVYILLLWSCLMVFHVSEQASGSQNKTNHTLDDEPLSSSDDVNMRGSGLAVQPLIPGVTVPFSHLPVLLAALLFSQIIHEAGHALSTIPENVPIHSVGLGLFVCLPSAFVSLSSVAFEKLPPLPRMRIAAAGAYHNLALWFILAILGWSGLGKLLSQGWTGWGTSFGPYKHVNDLGVSVQSIDPESDLGQYLYPGDIITRIEDTVLAHASLLAQRRTSLQLWHDLLLHHHYNVTIDDLPDMGWCVDAKWYKG